MILGVVIGVDLVVTLWERFFNLGTFVMDIRGGAEN